MYGMYGMYGVEYFHYSNSTDLNFPSMISGQRCKPGFQKCELNKYIASYDLML